MSFTGQAAVATILVTLTLWLQCAGMAILIRWARATLEREITAVSEWDSAVLMIRFTGVMIVLEILEILLWAAFYRWQCLPSWEACFYFSATSYSTVGYGDIILPRYWRVLGPVESVTGVLMSGISVSALFAILLRLLDTQAKSPAGATTPSRALEVQALEEVSIKEIG